MKKLLGVMLSVSLFSSAIPVVTAAETDEKATETISYTYSANEGKTYTREMEKLGRGLVAVKSGSGVFLSWRLLDSEDMHFGSADGNVSFNVYRGNEKIAEVSGATNYTDKTAGTSYSVAPVVNGVEGEKCEAVSVWNNNYIDIPLTKPANETVEYVYPYTDADGNTSTQATYSFFPADCSTGDLDGDGEYEIIVKWTSSERDVGSPGDPAYSGTVRFAAYKLDGTKLWDSDINLGKNVYSSAHTAQFLVYDFDGDGKSEMIVQTSLGSKDAKGKYVSHASADKTIAAFTDTQNEEADYRGYGRITTGEEFLTVFNGETGEAIDTIDLPTSRGSKNGVDYGDDFGNRSNRFVADVAYLDGEKPYAVYLRGYYFGRNGRQRTSIAGISFDGERLSPDYRFDTKSGQPGYYDGAGIYVGNGNHNCTVADVDNDGKDEFITGALCMEVKDDNSFKPRWCTFMEHGDALHIGDYDPTHNGFEFFTVHEDEGPNTMSGETVEINFGMSVIDADTGEIMLHVPNTKDTGRGCMANTGSGGFYQITGVGSYQCNGGTNFTTTRNGAGSNFRIFWDGDLYDELLDGTNVTNYNGDGFSASGCTKINGTKSNPGLQADLFGDWREELVYPTKDGSKLRVFTTTIPTEYKIKTLMHDPVYRSGVAAEQTAYNQPPHVGMYLSDDVFGSPISSIKITSLPKKIIYSQGEKLDTTGMVVEASYEDGTSKAVDAFNVSGYDANKTGKQILTVSYMEKTATFEVTVKDLSSITITSLPKSTSIYQGGTLNADGLVVKAVFSDNSSTVISDYTLSGYDVNTLGSQTVTVTYMGKTAEFKITVQKPDIAAINKNYLTNSTDSVQETVPIGSYKNDFTLEHTVTISSMPANGSSNKDTMAGFALRFMNTAAKHTGGGWYITASGNQAQIIWKNTKTTTIGKIDTGKTYIFKYEFSNVGTGTGASVKLTIIDENGKTVASQDNLNLRNFSDTDSGKLAPITALELCNQANAGSTAGVILDNALIYGKGEITSVNDKDITVNLGTTAGMKIYAAKYAADGALENVKIFTPENIGESTFTTDFTPDKVFIWAGVRPIDIWTK